MTRNELSLFIIVIISTVFILGALFYVKSDIIKELEEPVTCIAQ